MTILSLSGVAIQYGGEPLLTDIAITVTRGERWGIIGRNGSGKTSLFRIITGALVGSITGFQTAGRGTSIVGTLASGELVSISWRFGHNWRFRSVSGPTGPGVQISSLSSYVSVVGPAFVTAVDADGHTAVYRFRTNTDAWNLVSTAVAEEQVKRPVTSIYYRRDTNTASFLSFNVGGQLVLATQGGDGIWTEFDLSPKLAA